MFRSIERLLPIPLYVALVVLGVSYPLPVRAQQESAKKTQEEGTRKVKNRVQPIYPELARHLNLGGVVKIQLVVAPDGKVKNAKIVGGHPVLAEAALDAVKRWKYEPAHEETSDVVEIKFERPTQ